MPAGHLKLCNPSRSFCHCGGVVQLTHPHAAFEVLQEEPILARLRVPVAAVKSWAELVRCRQDVSVGGDLIPDSASMAVTRVVDVRCVLAEKLTRLAPPNPAHDNLARECRRIRSRYPAQDVE